MKKKIRQYKIKQYKVPIDMETMEQVKHLIEFSQKQYPFIEDKLFTFKKQLSEIVQLGCFRHNRLMDTYEVNKNEKITFCRKCQPELFDKYGRG